MGALHGFPVESDDQRRGNNILFDRQRTRTMY